MKTVYFLVLALFMSCASSRTSVNSLYEEPERQQLMKDYAFCKCLDSAFGEKITKEISEVDFTKGMLFDIADLGGIYKQLDSLALNASSKITVSRISDFGDAKPITFKCLEFHRSKELDTFVKSLK